MLTVKRMARGAAALVLGVAAMSSWGQGGAGGMPPGWVDPRAALNQQNDLETELVTYGRFSIASVDAINKLLADLEAPAQDLKAMIESAPFIGQGALAGDKPLGVMLVVTPNQPLMSEKNLIVALPVNAGKATAEQMTATGGKAVAGAPGVVVVEDMVLRRTEGYLFGRQGTAPTGMGKLVDTVFANDYKTAGNLLVASLDLAKLRTSAPDSYKQLGAFGSFLPLPAGDPEAPNPVQQMLDTIDRLTFTINRDDKNLQLQLWKMPFASKPVKPVARPAFPAGVIAQMHVVYPDAEAAMWVDKQIDQMQEASIPGPPEQRERMKAFLKRLAKFNGQAEAVSMAVAAKDDQPVFYVVDQLREEIDLEAELKAISEDLKVLAKDEIVGNELTTFDLGGKKVHRLALAGKQESQRAYIDAVKDGKIVFVTVGMKDEKPIEGLLAAGMNGQSSVLCAGVLDLTAALNVASSGAGGPLSMLPPDALAKLRGAFAGQGITWTVQGAEGGGNYVYTNIAFPIQAVREVVRLTTQMNAAPGGMAPGGGMSP